MQNRGLLRSIRFLSLLMLFSYIYVSAALKISAEGDGTEPSAGASEPQVLLQGL